MKAPVRVAVTGAAGQIGYALLFRIAAGEMLGKDQPVILQLLELPIDKAQAALRGVMMELEDCAFPLLAGMVGTGDPKVAFKDADYALLVGAKPRGPGMERKDLLLENAKIFIEQGKALDAVASRNVKVLVVGNPANTNAYIAMKSAPSLPKKNFTAMMRLDHNRALSQLAAKAERAGRRRSRSSSSGATIRRRCTPTTASRIVERQGAQGRSSTTRTGTATSSCPRSASAARRSSRRAGCLPPRRRPTPPIDHMRDWILGSNGKWVTMGVPSDGSYGIPEDVIYGVPVTTANGEYTRVRDLPIDDFSREKMNATLKELEEERAGVASLLG